MHFMRGDLIMHFMSLGFHELMINGTLQFFLSQPRNRNSSLINHRQKKIQPYPQSGSVHTAAQQERRKN